MNGINFGIETNLASIWESVASIEESQKAQLASLKQVRDLLEPFKPLEVCGGE
jgi:hypothetical protein